MGLSKFVFLKNCFSLGGDEGGNWSRQAEGYVVQSHFVEIRIFCIDGYYMTIWIL